MKCCSVFVYVISRMLLRSRLCIFVNPILFCVHQVHIRCKCLINTLLYYIAAKCIVK